jgi:hypothetical protein
MNEGRLDERNDPIGVARTIRVRLDAAQYQVDMDSKGVVCRALF